MGNIEIKTAQNVAIEFETATALERTIAFLIDLFIVWTIEVILFVFLGSMTGTTDLHLLEIILMVMATCLGLFAMVSQEILWGGQTIGKKAMGVKIIKTNGREATANDFFVRWGLKIIDVGMSLGFFAMFTVSSSKRGQRLGIVANTTVIKLKPSNKITLTELIKLHNKTISHEVVYPQAGRINDEYALAIKHILERHQKYNNDTTSALVKEIAEKVINELQIELKDKSYVKFLKTFLDDYVKLTR
jgi:uncharacterized RDD family membrane protein YckC